MFKGKPKSKDRCRRMEAERYHPGVVVIFNEKAYANTTNLIDWVKNQYSIASAYPLRDNEPRFLALDAFAPYKNKGAKVRENESKTAREKREKEERLQQELRDAFKKLNVTLSIIPGGYTGYVQVLDVLINKLINKLIKAYIEEYEDQWVEEHFDEWEAGKWSVGDRRVLLTEWIAKAFERVHLEHKDAIIACFKSVGLSLAVDSSEDHLLNVRDCPNLIFGDWQREPEVLGTDSAPIIIDDNDVGDTIEVDDDDNSLLYTAREVAEGITVKIEDENNITTDSRVSSDERFDPDSQSESDFDDDIDSDEDQNDENI